MWKRSVVSFVKVLSTSKGKTGDVSKELIPYVKSILGVDISQHAIKQYNENFKNDEKASGVCVELQGEEGELSGVQFDLIFVSSMPSEDDSRSPSDMANCSVLRPTTTLHLLRILRVSLPLTSIPEALWLWSTWFTAKRVMSTFPSTSALYPTNMECLNKIYKGLSTMGI